MFAFSLVVVFAASSPAPAPLGKLIDAGGYRVHLYCTGTGSPTVMVVGAGFSFDWGLVQPEVAKFTRICTYDPLGTAWSDPYPSSAKKEKAVSKCFDRVAEIHQILKNGEIRGPYVLVGYSLGGLVGRLYADEYPEDFAGMVLVDHALSMWAQTHHPLRRLLSGRPVLQTARPFWFLHRLLRLALMTTRTSKGYLSLIETFMLGRPLFLGGD